MIEKAWRTGLGMGVLMIALFAASSGTHGQTRNKNRKVANAEAAAVKYGSIKVDGLNIAYREAGNTNAYEIGFSAVWDGFRGALWKNRSAETEKPLEAFLTRNAIKGIYLFGAKNPALISPDNWESDFGFMQRSNAVRVNSNLFYDYRKNEEGLMPQWLASINDAPIAFSERRVL